MSIEIQVLDVGHGSCVALIADGAATLIDAGSGSTALEFLRTTKFQEVERVLISHADRDHVGGLINLLSASEFEVGSIWLNADAFKGSRLWRDLSYELDAWQDDHHELEIGVTDQHHFTSGQVAVRVLAPRARLVAIGPGGRDAENRRLESNTLSVVAMVDIDGTPTVLIPGDLDQLGLDHLLDREDPPSLQAPIMVFPHHGGHTSRLGSSVGDVKFTKQLLDLVEPEVIIFSNGRGVHDTPRPEIVSTAREALPNSRIACTQLSLHCAAAKPAHDRFFHLLPTVARGSSSDSCCAGSIRIEVNDGAWNMTPGVSHLEFIASDVADALCRR